jgi:hypothetical protein
MVLVHPVHAYTDPPNNILAYFRNSQLKQPRVAAAGGIRDVVPRSRRGGYLKLVPRARDGGYLVLILIYLGTELSVRNSDRARQRGPYETGYVIQESRVDEVFALLFFACGVI